MSYYQHSREEIRAFVPENYSNVLEVGCGNGIFRAQLSKPNTYFGIETNKDAAEKAKEQLDQVICSSFDLAFDQLPDEHFDLVVCNDVIEHMPDTDVFLQRIWQKMSPEGYIIGSVPNIRYFRQLIELMVQKDWQYKQAGILDNTHLRFYTYKSFKRTLKENGYLVEELSGINVPKPKNILKRLLLSFIGCLLGKDTLFPQIAFRIKKTNV